MIDQVQHVLKAIESNGLLITLLSGGVVVSLFMHAKDILSSLGKWILTLISFQIVNRYNTQYDQPEMLKKLLYFINENSKVLWMNQVELMEINEDRQDGKIAAAPHGKSYRLLYGKFLTIDKEYDTQGMKITTIVTIRVYFCFKKTFFKKFLTDMKDVTVKESKNNVVVNIMGAYGLEKQKRSIDSVYSSDGVPQRLVEDAKRFIKNEDIYTQCDIPYKRNYLLYGKPGTGKSSSVLALASELDWNIFCIDISKNRLEDVIRNVVTRRRTIFLFEDVDAAAKNLSERKKKEGDDFQTPLFNEAQGDISLSQLLNITDGLITPRGSICVFTTNHVETLDEAFVRDGRMDVKLEFNYFKSHTVKKMVHDRLGIILDHPKDDVCPASLQESILQVKIGNKSKEEFINEWSI